MKPAATWRRRPVFVLPAIVAAVTLIGLIAGLVGDGVADGISWLTLGSCLATIVWAIRRRG